MEISKKHFEEILTLAYKRGRCTPIRYIALSDIDKIINVLPGVVKRLRKLSPLAPKEDEE